MNYSNYVTEQQRSPSLQVHKLSSAGNNITCNDGSQIGYYKRLNQHSKSWVIFLQGGGFCGSRESCLQRWYRTPFLMSSKYWPNTKTGECNFPFASSELTPETTPAAAAPICPARQTGACNKSSLFPCRRCMRRAAVGGSDGDSVLHARPYRGLFTVTSSHLGACQQLAHCAGSRSPAVAAL